MRVIKDLSAEVPDTNGFYFRLDELSDPTSLENLYNGYNSIHNNFTEGSRQVVLNIWMPTEFAQVKDHFNNNALQYNAKATEVYGVCPYTTAWLNSIDLERQYKYIFYPFNVQDIPSRSDKLYDVCYFGGIHSQYHLECLLTMIKHNYRYMSMTHGINQNTQACLGYATDLNLTHQEKIQRVGECKISVCYNIVPADANHIDGIKSYPKWSENLAFQNVEEVGYFPQFKSRMHEAAIARTLNLVYKDPWGISEDYYTPDEEFVYFSSNEELEDKINDVLNNWSSYEEVVENAYNKSLSYTTQNMMDIISKGNEWNSKAVDLVAYRG